jgi:hypothetical protein
MKLGILYKNGEIVNHRSLIKVLLNPILRYFGLYIGTNCINNELYGIKLLNCKRSTKMFWDFNNHNNYDIIIKKRILI